MIRCCTPGSASRTLSPVLSLIVLAAIVFTPVGAMASSIITRTYTDHYSLSVVVTGPEDSDTCELSLTAEGHKSIFSISLRRPFYNCALFGSTQIRAGSSLGSDVMIVFVEAARGGDGVHTGPIIEVFRLGPKGFGKLGEVELFDATYVRKGGSISHVLGNLCFDFCNVCDGPEVSDNKMFIPVRLDIRNDSLVTQTTLDQRGKERAYKEFEDREKEAYSDHVKDEKYDDYVRTLETRFRALLKE